MCIQLGRIDWTFWMPIVEVFSVIFSVMVLTLVHGASGSVVIFASSDISLATQSLSHVIRAVPDSSLDIMVISQTLARVQAILSQVA